MVLHGVCVIGIMVYTLVGVLFFCLCTTTYLYFSESLYCISMWYLFDFVILYFVCLSLCPHEPLVLLSANCVTFLHDWLKLLGGCMHVFHHM